jgi:glutamyl-tRNA reductase
LVDDVEASGNLGYHEGKWRIAGDEAISEVKAALKIQVVGINHRDAPLMVRERVALTPDQIERAYARRQQMAGQEGLVILSTCNRTEFYVAGDVPLDTILAFWESLVLVPREEFVKALFWAEGPQAADHAMRVAAGIDSMVLGETQILGQVKAAYQMAQAVGAVGRLHRLFHYALRAGKRAHHETEIGRNALSVGHAVIELAKKVFGSLERKTALVIGAGEMGQLVARHLNTQSLARLYIANRSLARSESLARELGAQPLALPEVPTVIGQADVVVSCTTAPGMVVTREMVQSALEGRLNEFRFFFDLAVPRDIDPAIGRLSATIFLYDVDDVMRVVDANRAKRERAVAAVEQLIVEEVQAFQEEMGASEVAPVIRSLRNKAEAIRQAELKKAFSRLPSLTEEERAVVAATTRLMMNKWLNDPMVAMRRWSTDDQKQPYIQAVRELFRLGDDSEPAPVE